MYLVSLPLSLPVVLFLKEVHGVIYLILLPILS